jgi:hypothetical protein
MTPHKQGQIQANPKPKPTPQLPLHSPSHPHATHTTRGLNARTHPPPSAIHRQDGNQAHPNKNDYHLQPQRGRSQVLVAKQDDDGRDERDRDREKNLVAGALNLHSLSLGTYAVGGITNVTGLSIKRLTSAMNCAAVAP